MEKEKILRNFACDMTHKCAKEEDETKRCSYCKIGYSFVASDPRVLECGHLICFECRNQVGNASINCNICGVNAKCTEVKGVTADALFQLF